MMTEETKVDQISEPALIAKLTRRIIPFLVLVYLVAIIDRLNVGFAALTINRDLGLTATMTGAFQVPSLALAACLALGGLATFLVSRRTHSLPITATP
jgi:hypothetical protein